MNPFAIHNLTVAYEDETVLWDVSFSTQPGSLVGVIGPNGAGKSTLLKAALNIARPLSGGATFFGKPFSKVRRRVSYVPQRRDVDWNFPITVFDVALMGRHARRGILKWVRKADREAARHALEHMGLSHLAERQISQLSGGQQQRLFLTRALLQDADVYILDEPFAGVDIASERAIIETLKELKQNGKTVIVVHHDLHSAQEYFDQIVLLNVRLIATGSPEEVLTPEHLQQAYGSHVTLFEQASRRAHAKRMGIEV